MTALPRLKARVKVSFPSRVEGTNGVEVVKANGEYTIGLDLSGLSETPPISTATVDNYDILAYDALNDSYSALSLDNLYSAIPDGVYATAAQGAKADTAVQPDSADTLTNKTIDADNNTISNLAIGAEVTGASTDLTDTADILYKAGNLSGIADAATARDNIGAGRDILEGVPSYDGTFHWGGDVAAKFHTTTNGGTVAGGVDTASNTIPEIIAQYGMYSNHGSANAASAYKVAFTPWMVAGSGSANAYALNAIFQADSGFANLGTVCELDINNNSGVDYDYSSLGGGPDIHGMAIVSGSSTSLSSTALWVIGSGTKNFSNGIAITGSATIDSSDSSSAAFQDASNGYNVLRALGSHANGINLFGATLSGHSLICPNNRGIGIANAAGSAVISSFKVNGSDSIVIGDGTHNILLSAPTGNVSCSGIFYPAADNLYPLGTGSIRWSTVYAATGTINTSDPTLKTEINNLPQSLPIVLSIDPKTYKWIDGGGGTEEVEIEQTVPETETVEEPYDDIEDRDGRMVLVRKTRMVEREVRDEVPVFDIDGNQLFDTVPARAADQKRGIPGRPESRVARTTLKPRLVTKKVKVTRPCKRPGARTHWGFMAPDVKRAFDECGLDFGGYVKTPEGVEGLRPDQLIPVLWKAVQELAAEIDALKNSPKRK